jgi:CheY-like chemotaxis protein
MVHVDLSLIDLIAEPLVLLRDSQILACSAGALRILEGTPRAVEDLPPTLQRELRGRLADGSELWGIGPETNEGHLRRLLWEHPDAMLEVSPLGAVSWMNGAATQILGAGLENLLRAVAPGGQPAFTEALRRARAGAGLDATCPFEAQGESLPLRVSFVPHRRPGQILVWLHTSAPAARPQPVEGPLTASLAHDLNNALTVVTSALGEPGQSLGADSELLRLARVALQRAGQLASDLLFLARGPSAGPTEPCLLGEALDEASARLRAAGGGSLRIVGATPALPLWVEADATLVLRLIGLVSELALRGQPPSATLEVELSADPQRIALTFSPEGPATPPLAPARREAGPSLALAMAMAQACQGEVSQRIEEGRLRCRLSLKRSAAQAAPLTAALPLPRSLLLVDDETLVVRSLGRLLRRRGVETVLEAQDSEAALDLLARRPDIELAIFDLMMPGGDGLHLLREAHALRPGLPVVVMSGYARADQRLACLRAGAAAFLVKPFSLDDLIRALTQARSRPAGAAEA